MSETPEVVISARDVEFSFLIQDSNVNTLKNYLLSFGARKLFTRKKVLNGIDLDIYKGESFGILGINGAGKSTLLRVLAGIITPDKGEIIRKAKVSPILELGAGLEPELTGYENIKIISTLTGNPGKVSPELFGKVIEFSELTGKDLSMQVKRYSTGMVARLAFSIAVVNDPEILIIDEVISVGDHGFQKKCINRIFDIRNNGGTIIYVSHHYDLIEKLCNRAAFLKNGKIFKVGSVDETGKEYLKTFQ